PLTLSNSVVRDSYTVGLRIEQSTPTVTGTIFQHNSISAVSMDLASNPSIHGVTLSDNGVNGLRVDAGLLAGNGTWDHPDIVYVMTGDVTIPAGRTLTIAPGQIVKFFVGSNHLLVNGTLSAQGTTLLPIIFTSYRDDAAGGDTNNNGADGGGNGDWAGIHVNA